VGEKNQVLKRISNLERSAKLEFSFAGVVIILLILLPVLAWYLSDDALYYAEILITRTLLIIFAVVLFIHIPCYKVIYKTVIVITIIVNLIFYIRFVPLIIADSNPQDNLYNVVNDEY